NIPLYGRSFGNYIVNITLSIDLTICDSLVFESAWGPHTNAFEWDSNYDVVASKIPGIFDNNTMYNLKYMSLALLFDETLRPKFLRLLSLIRQM
ncbi:hypothetical protein AKO1_002605, partial [Acrasis kona]